MSVFRVAHRYAKSLLELAIEKNQVEEVNRDVRYMQSVMQSSRPLRVFLKSPIIEPALKIKALDKLFGSFNEITTKFLRLIVKKRREEYLEVVVSEFIDQYNQYKGITKVYLTTAAPLGDEAMRKIQERYIERSGMKGVEMNTIIDESLIGGFIFRFNDRMYDTSISRQLEKMDNVFRENLYTRRIGGK